MLQKESVVPFPKFLLTHKMGNSTKTPPCQEASEEEVVACPLLLPGSLFCLVR